MINVYSRKYEIRMSVNLETLQHMITVELSSCICFILWLLRFLGTFISFFVVVYCLIYVSFPGLHWKCCDLECNVVILWHWAEWKSKSLVPDFIRVAHFNIKSSHQSWEMRKPAASWSGARHSRTGRRLSRSGWKSPRWLPPCSRTFLSCWFVFWG